MSDTIATVLLVVIIAGFVFFPLLIHGVIRLLAWLERKITEEKP